MQDIASNSMLKTSCTVSSTSVAGTLKMLSGVGLKNAQKVTKYALLILSNIQETKKLDGVGLQPPKLHQ